MRKEDQRLMLAGNALQGLLASQNAERGWPMDTLAVVSLKIADTLLQFHELPELPELVDARKKEEEQPSPIIVPDIITP